MERFAEIRVEISDTGVPRLTMSMNVHGCTVEGIGIVLGLLKAQAERSIAQAEENCGPESIHEFQKGVSRAMACPPSDGYDRSAYQLG